MSTRLAIVQRNQSDDKRTLNEEQLRIPKLEKSQVLVKVERAALNPTDVQSFDGDAFGDGAVLGCDFAGTVEQVGSEVSRLKASDKVAALIWGGEIKGLGAYSTYCVAEEKIAFRIPEGLDYASASTVPLAANTAWLALFSKDCLRIPKEPSSKLSILVWGGSSTVGIFTIQFAKMYGFNIVTTCSPRNFDIVKKHGATHVFDYSDKDVVKKIAEAVPDLAHAFDCIGNSTSSTLSAHAMGDKKGVICTVRPGKQYTENLPKNVEVTDVLVFTAFLKPHVYKEVFHWPTHPEDHALSVEMYEKLPEWTEEGKIKPQNAKDMGTLSVKSLIEATALNRSGKVSNEKLCFQVGGL